MQGDAANLRNDKEAQEAEGGEESAGSTNPRP